MTLRQVDRHHRRPQRRRRPQRAMSSPRRLAAAGMLALLVACGSGQAAAPDDPYAGFPACAEAPSAVGVPGPVEGLVLPHGATVLSTSVDGPLTTVNAYVAATPLAVREELSQLRDVQVLSAEDEVFEAELLLAADNHRSLVTAVAVCDAASRIVAVVSPAADEGLLPAPGGAAP